MKKKFFYSSIVWFYSFLLISIFINFKIDSYGVYGHSLNKQVLEANQNYVKTNYILKNSEKYDSFIFGSSKVGSYDVSKLTNGKYYNMSYSQGVPYEWLDSINVFLNNKIKIKNIIIGIDSFSLSVDPLVHNNEPMRAIYSKIDFLTKIKLYLIKSPFSEYNYLTVLGRIQKKDYDFFNNKYYSDIEASIEQNIENHREKKEFNIPIAFNYVNRTNETLEELRKIKKICDENNIKLFIIINPIHSVTYKYSNIKEFEYLKHNLAKISDYWDFSDQNSFLTDNYFWYETSHIRPMISDLILKIIFKDQFKKEIQLKISENNFGEYIGKK